jgi:tetratricopeptide (TPR) repeat protein
MTRVFPSALLASSLCLCLVLEGSKAAAQSAAPPSAPPRPAAAAPAGPSFEQLAKKAAEAKEAGRLDEAMQYFRQALQKKPDWTEGHWALGALQYDLDQYQEARDHFRRVVQADPKNGLVLALEGLCDFQLKNYERALDELQKARTLGIASPEVLSTASYQAAILLNRFEKYEQAFELLRDFSLQDKDSLNVIEAFGLSVLRMPFLPSEAPPEKRELILMAGRGGYQMAKGRRSAVGRMAFEELVARYPTAPNVHYAYGIFCLTDEPDTALEEFRRELRSSPNHYHAMLQIAYEQMKRGNYQEALPLAEKAVELAPNLFAARNALGRALLETGATDRAIRELEAGVKLAPDSPEVRFALARAYQRAGRTEDAARQRAEFLALDRAARAARSGPQSVGGKPEEPENPAPKEN